MRAETIEEIIKDFRREQRELIHILHRIQSNYGYIPSESIKKIANHLKITESEIFGVLTFYKAFNLKERGNHLVTVCLGTACHVRGAMQIVEEMKRKLKIEVGETTPDKKITLETVNCLGCCAIGPVVVVDGRYHSHVSLKKIDAILKNYRHSE